MFVFDEDKANNTIKFIESLKHGKGRWSGQKFKLLDWQLGIINPLFGMVDEFGLRQYRTCYVEIPKKNGKSELAAAVALKLLFADNEPGAEVYSAAADRSQASLVFNVAANMVRNNPILSNRCKIIDSQKRIVVYKTSSFYCALSADVKTKHGLNASGIIFDELHAQPNRELWDVLTLGSGAARTQPLIFAITTAGYDRNSICWEQHEYADRILKGIVDDPRFLPIIYGVPESENWEDESNWTTANPSLGHILRIEDLREDFKKAKETPSLQNSFRRLRLNQWTQSATRFIDLSKWDECTFKIDINSLRNRECYGGLDLSSTTDLTALSLVFPPSAMYPFYFALFYFWIPEERMHEKIKIDRVPYDIWSRDGIVEATPGDLIDYDYVVKTLVELRKMFNIKEVAFDRWGSAYISTKLTDLGFNMVEFGQGYASMSPATKDLEAKILSKQIKHQGLPIMRWMMDNLVVQTDPAGNIKPSKEKSSQKIDGCVALAMALDRAVRNYGNKPSVYNERGILSL